MNLTFTLKRAWMAWLLVPVLLSCNSYNQKLARYYTQLENRQYNGAMRTLESNGFMQKDRNRLLYYLERGKLYHMMQQYDSSNTYFNLADNFIETNFKTTGDAVKAAMLNPMLTTYLGEDHERFLMHYYKALNYVALGKTDDALVEARRITLASNAQTDKNKKFKTDAFALSLQGILYEMAGDINNAFIAYRNAADVYLNAANKTYYGVTLPAQLQQDVLRTAQAMGFTDLFNFYSQQFATGLQTDTTDHTGGYLTLFFEKGFAPVKKERNFMLTRDGDGTNGFYYYDEDGNQVNVPFNYAYYPAVNQQNASARTFRVFRVAVPYYDVRYGNNNPVNISVNGTTYTTQTAENVNEVAVKLLRDRWVTEMANAIARQIVKKLAEKGASEAAKAVAKDNSKEKDEKKKNEKAEEAGEIAGLIVNLFNTFTEKADTRNWQSLPAYIQYVRIPLKSGPNTITLQTGSSTKSLVVNGTGGIQLQSIALSN
jgi:hypothetical protein